MSIINDELKADKAVFKFQYMPLNGKLSGMSFEQQTEDVINDIGNIAYKANENSENATDLAEDAMKAAQNAQQTADKAQTTANNALDIANAALNAGGSAGESAAAALLAAQKAQESANQANTKVDNLTIVVDEHTTNINMALDLAQNASNKADSALGAIEAQNGKIENITTLFENFTYKVLDEATDLNNLYGEQLGRYRITNVNDSNLPIPKIGWLDVDLCDDDVTIRQTFSVENTSDVYTRYGFLPDNESEEAPTWGGWTKNSTETELDSVKTALDSFVENSYTQAEIDDKLSSKAPLESPAFTGTPTAPTPDKTANNTQIATTAFVHSTLNKIVEEGAYLPLTGGAMEGSIVLGSSSEIIKGNGKYNLVFAANTKFDNGANFILYPPGTSNTEFAGGFTLRTMDDNNIVFLEGTPKGSFKWNNKEIVRSVNGVVAGADGDVVIEIPKPDLSKYVPTSEVGNAANKIPKYNTSGHLVLPNGAEFWIA